MQFPNNEATKFMYSVEKDDATKETQKGTTKEQA